MRPNYEINNSMEPLDLTRNSLMCCVCGKRLGSIAQRKRHEKFHFGARPFHCDYKDCTATFKLKHHLKEHLNIHTGAKPHKCGMCGKYFAHSGSLSMHNSRKHRKRNNDLI